MEAGTTWRAGCRGWQSCSGEEWRLVLPGGLATKTGSSVLHGMEWRLVLPGGLAAETGSSAVVKNGGWYYLGNWLQRLFAW